MQKQQTLKEAFTLKGKGLHTGQVITAVFNPAEENYGYKIQRTDMEGQPIIECNADLVGDTQRGTVLVKNAGDGLLPPVAHMSDLEEFQAAGQQNAGADKQDEARQPPDRTVDSIIDRFNGFHKVFHTFSSEIIKK